MAEFRDALVQQHCAARAITLEEINACLNDPEGSYQHRDEIVYFHRQADGRTLKVSIRDGFVVHALRHY